ncbi:MAG: hypothetical protein R3A79_00810 [Nannocystaceae bacterium]
MIDGRADERPLARILELVLPLVDHEAEVEDARPPVAAEEHVLRLEVAVDEARRVGGVEPPARVAQRPQELAPRHVRAAKEAAEILAVDELHRQVDAVVVLADLIDLDDEGAREARERLGLAEHPLADLRLAGELLLDQLDRDLAIEIDVVAGVDDAHRPLAYLPVDDEGADRRRR